MSGGPTRVSAVTRQGTIIAAVITVVLHFAWEMAQSPFFQPFAGNWLTGTGRCLGAAVGDLAIATVAYLPVAALFGLDWPIRRYPVRPALLWTGISLLITVTLEYWFLRQGRWSYRDVMPTVFGIGLLPMLQWVVVPLLSLRALRYILRRVTAFSRVEF